MPPEGPWAGSIPVAGAPADSYEPALAATADAIHAVWVSNKTLYHSHFTGGRWQDPTRFAGGEQPALATAPDGSVHCAFSHWFLGNCEIYHARWQGGGWSLPRLVSRTSGVSTQPALSIGRDGGAHIAWADNTPGTTTIYYARPHASAWANGPIPNAPGSRPGLAVAPTGEVYATWQDRVGQAGCFEILAAICRDGSWSVPEIVSDNQTHHSLGPALVINPQGTAHLIWQDERNGKYVVRHSERLPGGWSRPVDVSSPVNDARLPRIAAAPKGTLQAMWVEGSVLKHRACPPQPSAPWWGEEAAGGTCPGISSLAVAISPSSGELHTAWSAYDDSEQRRLFHTYRAPLTRHTVFMPLTSGPG